MPTLVPPVTDARSNYETKLAITVGDFRALTGAGEFAVRRMLATGELPSVRMGRRVVIPVSAVRAILGDAE